MADLEPGWKYPKPGISDSARWVLFITLIEVLLLGGVFLALWKMC